MQVSLPFRSHIHREQLAVTVYIAKSTENSFKLVLLRHQLLAPQPSDAASAWAKEQATNLRKHLSSKFRALVARREWDSKPCSCWSLGALTCSLLKASQPEAAAAELLLLRWREEALFSGRRLRTTDRPTETRQVLEANSGGGNPGSPGRWQGAGARGGLEEELGAGKWSAWKGLGSNSGDPVPGLDTRSKTLIWHSWATIWDTSLQILGYQVEP